MTKVTFRARVFAKLTHLISEHFAGLAGIIASAGDKKKQLFLLRISLTDAEFTADYNNAFAVFTKEDMKLLRLHTIMLEKCFINHPVKRTY